VQQEDVARLKARIETLEAELSETTEKSMSIAEHQQDMKVVEEEIRADSQELEQLRQEVGFIHIVHYIHTYR
jgi:hypothetical protein